VSQDSREEPARPTPETFKCYTDIPRGGGSVILARPETTVKGAQGYEVRYTGTGSTGFRDRQWFDSTYTCIDNREVGFSVALQAMLYGFAVELAAWHPRQVLTLERPGPKSEITEPMFCLHILPHSTPSGKGQCLPWCPTHQELLSKTWRVIVPPMEQEKR